jgi:hypothetical protein
MNFSWMFGNSLEARHLLYAYLLVWVVQGGYAASLLMQWLRLGKQSRQLRRRDTGA